jgi:hypothetical protein
VSRKPRLYLAFLAVVSVLAVVPATSSAAQFNWSEQGTFSSKALGPQVLNLAGGSWGSVRCGAAAGSGTHASTQVAYLDLKVTYSNCSAFGFAGPKVSPVTYRYYADGRVDILTPLTIEVSTYCTMKIEPHNNLTAVQYANNGGKLKIENAISGIAHTSSGPAAGVVCPPSSSNGTLTGLNELERVGGGTVGWQP